MEIEIEIEVNFEDEVKRLVNFSYQVEFQVLEEVENLEERIVLVSL